MPRPARQISNSGFYHVILQGNGKRILFEIDADKRFFLSLLDRYGEKYGIEYHAWCLLDNHVHLLVCDEKNQLSQAMHDIAFTFAQHYNNTNDHIGAVFQKPFKSFPIEDERYLLEVMRYIHNNPVRAELPGGLNYLWSSYGDYLKKGALTSTKFILEILGGVEEFIKFCMYYDPETAREIDMRVRNRMTDGQAIEMAKTILGVESLAVMEGFDREERDDCFEKLLQAGIPVRQVGRITGFGKHIVSRTKQKRGRRAKPLDRETGTKGEAP